MDSKKQTPQAFNSHGIGGGGQYTQYLSDIHIYDIENCSWHAPITSIVERLGSTTPIHEVGQYEDMFYINIIVMLY